MLKVVIVDDEEGVRSTISKMVSFHCANATIVGEASTKDSAIQLIKAVHPDVVLLDVNLSKESGFDILKAFDTFNFKVIFITAHREYALDAIKFSALDYLLKPVDPFELVEAINKAENTKEENTHLKLEAFVSNTSSNILKKIVLKTLENIFIKNLDDIIYCSADNNYTVFYCTDDTRIVVSKTLKMYDDLLCPQGFFRIHQSHLINLSHLERFDKREGGFAVMTNKAELPVSVRRKEILLEMLEKL